MDNKLLNILVFGQPSGFGFVQPSFGCMWKFCKSPICKLFSSIKQGLLTNIVLSCLAVKIYKMFWAVFQNLLFFSFPYRPIWRMGSLISKLFQRNHKHALFPLRVPNYFLKAQNIVLMFTCRT